MLLVGFSKSGCLLIAFSVYYFSFILLVCALDTITPSLTLKEPETVSSSNDMFTLGFFSPQNSTNRYVGIWFMSKSSIVWVANRNKPLSDSSGVLTISDNGNLVVLNGQKQVVWSTNVSSTTSNSSAQLLNSGSLVLVDRTTGAFMWQSFQHPSDTLLKDMKLITNQKEGKKIILTAWKSPSDPSYGGFSCSLEPRNVTEVFVWRENLPHWRSGPWNGRVFLGRPRSSYMSSNAFQIKIKEGNFELYFNFTGQSLLTTFRLDPQGNIEEQRWNSKASIWESVWTSGYSECDVYGKCGPFGICNSLSSPICSCMRGFEPTNKKEWEKQNWTSGCVRRKPLEFQCERGNNGSQASKADVFLKLERVKLPDQAEVLPYDIDQERYCGTRCLKSCSCMAYSYDTGLGCMIWNADLLDIQSFSDGGMDLHIRLAYSEIGTGRNVTTPIIISVLTGAILITASGYFLWKKWSKHKGEKQMQVRDQTRITNLKQVHIPELSLFDYRKLTTATNNFALANELGKGGFGSVYKGKLKDGQEIAVKRLSRSSGQGMEEFMNEVELISKLQHRNLVRLLGCCIEREVILVYEYMPNKSLDAFIFDPLQQKSLDWVKRFNIIEGIARGLLYLHRDSRLRIIHRDLKPSNILLDEGMNPRISDFGMAKLFGGSEGQANTKRIVGTYGYISPEYATEGLYSEKSDVFSFGVLLLEIICGRKNTSFYEDAESLSLLGFAWKSWINANAIPLIDPQIYEPRFNDDILRCIHIGLLCVQELAKDRPTMASVMSMIQSKTMDIPPLGQPAFILRQTMSHAAKQTSNIDKLCSINELTVSNFDGR